MKLLLKPVELAYRGVNRLRRGAYRAGVLRARRLPRPVVSIGNLSIGGSGKTPATIAIARLLAAHGVRVTILTRGYGRSGEAAPGLVEGSDAARFGDEPVLMAQALPAVPVVVGADRHAAGESFLRFGDCDLFLLDDAMQHLQLARDCNIVLETPFSGWRREGDAALRDATIVLLRDGAATNAPPAVPRFVAHVMPSGLRDGEVLRPLDDLRGMRVVVFAGLARNEAFFSMLRDLGSVVLQHRPFADHHPYTAADIAALRELAEKHDARLVTTAKDAVKLAGLSVLVLEIGMTFDDPEALTAEILKQCGLGR